MVSTQQAESRKATKNKKGSGLCFRSWTYALSELFAIVRLHFGTSREASTDFSVPVRLLSGWVPVCQETSFEGSRGDIC